MARDLNVDQIKKLWVLDLIIRSGSLKKAALQAQVSPSAISQTLSSLEQSVGKSLLVRDRGRVTPTQDALAILGVVRPAFDAFDRLRDLNQAPLPKMSWLNFGAYESIAIDVLPGLVHSLKEKMPKLKLGVRVSRTGQLLTMIRKGELCSALVTETDDVAKFYAREVARDRLGVYVSARHPIASEGLRALEERGLGALAAGKEGHPRYYTRFMKQLDPAKPAMLSDSFEILRATAAAGAIAAVLPHRVASRTDDLLEITPKRAAKDRGEHGIYVLSLVDCDREETDFLAAEATRLFERH